jgi:predicted lipoprotein with Yx(FWY)xxD motif
MRKAANHRSIFSLSLLALLSALLVATGLAGAAGTKTVAKKAGNASVDKFVLTNVNGRTLYTLSGERNGKFICTAACLKSWPPLVVPGATQPIGPVKLGTVKRPDGKMQVTYKGAPVYTFSGDAKKGDVNGEGLKTGTGTWHLVSLGALTRESPPPPAPQPPNPYGY